MSHAIAPIHTPSAWKGSAIDYRAEGLHRLSEAEIDEIDAALAHLKRLGEVDFPAITVENFPLPRFGEFLRDLGRVLRTGPGFLLLRGLPREHYSVDDLAKIYFGFGAYVGRPLPQSWHGELLGHVLDISDLETGARGYNKGGSQRFHTDSCDVIGLMCVRAAVSGGASRIASAMAVHNALLAANPDHARELYDGIPFRRMEQDAAHGTGTLTKKISVYACEREEISVSLSAQYAIRAVQAGDAQADSLGMAALEHLEQIAASPGYYLDMNIGEGDIQFLNNRLMIHGRTGYEDRQDVRDRRHMMRLWLRVNGWSALPERQSNHSDADYQGWLRQRRPAMEMPTPYLTRMATRYDILARQVALYPAERAL
ncbi:MAG: taurine catabolism dioxygenase TauD [Acetobacteraceae bacterium]|nr:taurine catabolism dioxygenase TauD [Acetobacteraceae bacterium]MSP29118.1 taurine catabolism dioxygenase TauD [Acetobacteraceae bacterium]